MIARSGWLLILLPGLPSQLPGSGERSGLWSRLGLDSRDASRGRLGGQNVSKALRGNVNSYFPPEPDDFVTPFNVPARSQAVVGVLKGRDGNEF